jgi:flagellar P-ring protein precursor FlgI
MRFIGNAPRAAALALVMSMLCAGSLTRTAVAQDVVHLKDVAHVQGVTANQLIGYGLVTGLAGTGDTVTLTSKTIQNMLQSFGISTLTNDVKTKNVAAVIVTASLPPFAHSGDNIDVTVSSMGDSSSLQGGTLVLSELRGPNNLVYATAQGPISIGGFGASAGGESVVKNHPAAGRIPQGGVISRDMTTPIQQDASGFSYVLTSPDYKTASHAAAALNGRFGPGTAHAVDAETVRVTFPAHYVNDPVSFLADAGDVSLTTNQNAKVVINERTGTIVFGGDITLSPVAIAHGNLTLTITQDNVVVPASSFTNSAAATQTNTTIKATESGKKLIFIKGAPTLAQVVRSLNTIGVSPRDLIAIVQALRESGSLQADLDIM